MSELKEPAASPRAGATVEELQRQLDASKSSQAGSDRRVSELTAERDQLRAELGKLSGVNVETAESLKLEAEKIKAGREALKLMAAGEIPLSALDLILPESDNVRERVDKLGALLKERDSIIRNQLLGSGPRPGGGGNDGGLDGEVKSFSRRYGKMSLSELKQYQKDHPQVWQAYVRSQARGG